MNAIGHIKNKDINYDPNKDAVHTAYRVLARAITTGTFTLGAYYGRINNGSVGFYIMNITNIDSNYNTTIVANIMSYVSSDEVFVYMCRHISYETGLFHVYGIGTGKFDYTVS